MVKFVLPLIEQPASRFALNHSKPVGNTCELAILPSPGSAEDLQDERAEDGAHSQTFTQGDRHYAETERSRQHRQIH